MDLSVRVGKKHNSRISEEVIEDLYRFTDRCYECGSTCRLQIHHRIFISEGELYLKNFLTERFKEGFCIDLEYWKLDDIQNLIILCSKCHEADYVGVHGGNSELNNRLRNSFTCPITGLNLTYKKYESTWNRS